MAFVEIFALVLKLVWVKKTQKKQCGKNVLLIKKIILEMLHGASDVAGEFCE